MNTKKIFLFGLISGVLLGLAFPPYPFNLLAFAAFIPLFHALDNNIKRKYLLIYLVFFIYHGITNYWISSWQKDSDPFLMISGIAIWLVHPFFFMFPFAFYDIIKRRAGTDKIIWLFPFIWVFYEWLHSVSEFAYPWLTIGYSQVKMTSWVQFADIAGVWGVSFVIVLFNVALYRILVYFKSSDGLRFNRQFFQKRIPSIVIILLCIILPLIYSLVQLPKFNHEELMKNNKTITIGLIQPNINPWRKWELSAAVQVELHKEIMDSLQKKHPDINLYVWSETAITLLGLSVNSSHDFSFVDYKLDEFNASLLSGFADIYMYKEGEKPGRTSKKHRLRPDTYYDSYNSAVLVQPTSKKKDVQIYHKMRLTPFGERIPYLEYYSFALKWLEWGVGISNWSLGAEQKVLNVPIGDYYSKLGAVICIESIFPDFVRRYSKHGAEVLSVITNDAWYDFTIGPEQHYNLSMMRAIENKRYIARCANTGVSGFITALGTNLSKADPYQRVGLYDKVPLIKSSTFYSEYGDFLPILCTAISILYLIYSLLFRTKLQKH